MPRRSLPGVARRTPIVPLFALLSILSLPAGGCGSGNDGLTVYAASSLTGAIQEAARIYSDSTGEAVILRFGASGLLATAIDGGAPADIFIAADASWIEHLETRKRLVADSARILAWNRLVAVVPAGADSAVPGLPVELLRLRRIAVGDPDVVPVGRYARQALTNYGLWDVLEGRLILAPEARAVLALAERGEVDAAIVYESDAGSSDRVRIGFVFPDRRHDPVAYPGAITSRSRRRVEAERFLGFLSTPRGRAILGAHGLQVE